jgi:hypothetical protein
MFSSQSKITYRCAQVLLLFLSVSFFAMPLHAQAPSSGATSPAPTIMVQIRCKPGTADQWQAAFEKDMLPAIQEVINKGEGITRFSYLEPVLPASPIDFVLLFQLKTLGGLDTKQPWPHYVALARRVGEARAEQIQGELGSWEDDVKVTLMRSHDGRP